MKKFATREATRWSIVALMMAARIINNEATMSNVRPAPGFTTKGKIVNLKAAPFFLVVIFSPIKLLLLYSSSSNAEFILWLIGVAGVFIWPTWAYWKDKDMPARGGDFQFRADGVNFVPRTAYVCVLLACFVGMAVFA